MANEQEFLLKVIAPDRVFYENQVNMVEFNTTEGEIGIYKNHIPMTVIVNPGILTITEAGEKKEAALHAGFAEILPDMVTILAEVIEWPSEINLERAEEAYKRAEERIQSQTPDTDLGRAETALNRAIARINVLK